MRNWFSLLIVLAAASLTLAASAHAAPHYKSCGTFNEAPNLPIAVYASRVACSVAFVVEHRCRVASCPGFLPSPLDGALSLPMAPASLPLGFRCYQAYAPYTVGLPPISPSKNGWILCERDVLGTANGSGLIAQRVAYWAK